MDARWALLELVTSRRRRSLLARYKSRECVDRRDKGSRSAASGRHFGLPNQVGPQVGALSRKWCVAPRGDAWIGLCRVSRRHADDISRLVDRVTPGESRTPRANRKSARQGQAIAARVPSWDDSGHSFSLLAHGIGEHVSADPDLCPEDFDSSWNASKNCTIPELADPWGLVGEHGEIHLAIEEGITVEEGQIDTGLIVGAED